MIKKSILFAGLATLVIGNAYSLNVRNSREATKLYLHTNIGGAHNEDLFTAKAHQTTSQSIITQLGDLKADLNVGEKGEYKFCFIDENKNELCSQPYVMTKETTAKELQEIDAKTINLSCGCKIE